MTTKLLGETLSGTFTCTNSAGALFNPDVVQVSFVKDYVAGSPSSSLYEDVLTYLGSEPRDSQLVKLGTGSFAFSYATDRVGQWSVKSRYTDDSLPAGGMVTSDCNMVVQVVLTEHQFVDREAMIPPGGGAPVSVPYATPTSGGMLTDAMAIKFDGIPADAQSAAEVGTAISTGLGTALADYSTTTAMGTAISGAITAIPDAGATRGLITTEAAAAAAAAYYVANWAVTDWYINAATGDDANDGSEAHPLATPEELSARLAVAVPIAHPVTVHIAQGSYGTLAVRVIQSALSCPFDVVGEVVYTDIGTVTSYTDRVVATNTAAHLVASGVTDWTPYVGKLVEVTSGAQDGAILAIAKGNPHSAGATVARVTRAATWDMTAALQSAGVADVADGSGLSVMTLPTIACLSIESDSPCSNSGTAVAAWRGVGAFGLNAGELRLQSTAPVVVDRCTFAALACTQFSGIKSNVAQPLVCRSVGDLRTSAYLRMSRVAAKLCLFIGPGAANVNVSDQCNFSDCLVQGATVQAEQSSFSDVGVFDATGTGYGFSCSKVFVGYLQVATLWGRDNSTYGFRTQTVSRAYVGATSYITGASGDVIVGTSVIPWTALPWVDGERSGEATLLVSGAGHNAEATSYVDVTVPYVLTTQKITACAKTFGGAPGFLSAAYVNATTIRITSSSATDTSIITWHILPVGDNAVIRS